MAIDFENYRGIYKEKDNDRKEEEKNYFYWCNFMSGIAIIVHKDKMYEMYPVKILEDGFKFDRWYENWK